jgi:molybdopterin converting factor small subunit
VEATGSTLEELLRELDQRYPGFRFRIIDEQDSIRPHIKIFVNYDQARDLAAKLRPEDEVSILLALSGG